MEGDAAGPLLVIAGDGAGLGDAADAARAPVTVSVWRLPASEAGPAQSVGGTGLTLLCSHGRLGGWSWPWSGRLAACEPFCGWTVSVSPNGRRIAVAQPGAELLIFGLQVRALNTFAKVACWCGEVMFLASTTWTGIRFSLADLVLPVCPVVASVLKARVQTCAYAG